MTTRNRWGRALGAGVLVELAFIVLISATMAIYAATVSRKAAEFMPFGHAAIVWYAYIGGPIVTFVLTRWALRPLSSAHVAHALVVAGTAVAIHIFVAAGSIAEGTASLLVYALAEALKVAAAVAAAMLAQRNSSPAAV